MHGSPRCGYRSSNTKSKLKKRQPLSGCRFFASLMMHKLVKEGISSLTKNSIKSFGLHAVHQISQRPQFGRRVVRITIQHL